MAQLNITLNQEEILELLSEVFKWLHAKYLASESKVIGPHNSKLGCLSRAKD